jgi:hypothetical protein
MNYVYRIRESTPEDKQAVLEIHKNVYDGLDYLPEYYDHFQTSDHVTSYVYMENDEIVSIIKSNKNYHVEEQLNLSVYLKYICELLLVSHFNSLDKKHLNPYVARKQYSFPHHKRRFLNADIYRCTHLLQVNL